MTAPRNEIAELPKENWEAELGGILSRRCAASGRALLCITGKAGAGKTTFARKLRLRGLPGFKPSQIAVIDDGVLSAPLFGLINRRIRFACEERDDLAPFEPHLRGKKIVVYVSIRPEERITRCDVLLRLRCRDEERRQRLVSSRHKGEIRYERSLGQTDEIKVAAGECYDLRSD